MSIIEVVYPKIFLGLALVHFQKYWLLRFSYYIFFVKKLDYLMRIWPLLKVGVDLGVLEKIRNPRFRLQIWTFLGWIILCTHFKIFQEPSLQKKIMIPKKMVKLRHWKFRKWMTKMKLFWMKKWKYFEWKKSHLVCNKWIPIWTNCSP